MTQDALGIEQAALSQPADCDAVAATQEAQGALFDGESDDALFLGREELEKRYTGEQARKIDSRRELILLAVAAGWPVERIAASARATVRTVRALAAREAEKVTWSAQDYVKILRGKIQRWLILASTKEQEADFKELVAAVSYLGNQAHVMEQAMGAVVGEEHAKGTVVDIESTARRIMELVAPDVESGGTVELSEDFGGSKKVDTGMDTRSDSDLAGLYRVLDGRGGGGCAAGGVEITMPSAERVITGKTS